MRRTALLTTGWFNDDRLTTLGVWIAVAVLANSDTI